MHRPKDSVEVIMNNLIRLITIHHEQVCKQIKDNFIKIFN